MAGKYTALEARLSGASQPVILTFRDVDALVGGLPPSAREYRTWWGNSGRGQSASWIAAGHVVASVDMADEVVVFEQGQPQERGPQSRSGGTRRAEIMDGTRALEQVVRRAGWEDLVAAVAAHTVFLHPAVVAQAGPGALFPIIRDPSRRGEVGESLDGRTVLFDDNGPPTDAFLWSARRRKGSDVQFNHVWTCSGDPDAYTALWNLCCTPAFLAKTTDTHAGVVAALRYRSYEQFGHLPASESTPRRPDGYEYLQWADSPEPMVDLEQELRARMRAAPKRRATVAAATIGWRYSEGPDSTLT